MNRSSEPLDTDESREQKLQPYHVVYLVQHPSYEFIFAVPRSPSPLSDGNEPFFQVYFHPHRNRQEVTLDLDELQEFYDSLSHLMEYLQIERRKRQEMN